MEEKVQSSPAGELGALLASFAAAVNEALAKWLGDARVPPALAAAMRHSALDGGKRLRPALVMLSASAVADARSWPVDPLPAAVAMEMVHSYSLVHDDLPAMDNDTLRRGRPTTHVAFGEAMAILAGDALLTRAFEVIVRGVPDLAIAARLVGELAAAAGPAGMIAGQVADMGMCDLPAGADGVRFIHLRKTAELFRAATRMGGLCAGATETQLAALGEFGQTLGLAFQAADDLLDATATAKVLGKTPGKDAQAHKRTYVAELGLTGAAQLVDELTRQALTALDVLGDQARDLRTLATLLCRRDR
jgi:geranylgeranyl diphosphate synthase type II